MTFVASRQIRIALFVLAVAAVLMPAAAVAQYDIYPIDPPCRAYDSRGQDAELTVPSGPLDGGVTYTVKLSDLCGLPASADGVAISVAVIGAADAGDLSVFSVPPPDPVPPDEAPSPQIDAISFPGLDSNGKPTNRAKDYVVAFAPGGTISFRAEIASSGKYHLKIDITGFFTNTVVNDDTATVTEDVTATAIDVLANDSDPDDTLLIASVTQPANGTVMLTGGTAGAHTGLTYTPNPNYCNNPPGTTLDTFTYTLTLGPSGIVNVTVDCENDAPVVTTTGGATSFTEDGGPVVVDSGVTVADIDNANLASATVTITDPQDGASEVLAATACPGLTVTPGLNTLSITGSQPKATYQTCLQSVTYDNTSQDPTGSSRVISFVANDGTLSSAAATKNVVISAVANAPVVTTTAGTTPFTEDGSAVVVDSGVTVSDPDSANLASATVTITNPQDGASEVLAATACPGLTVTPGLNTLSITGSQSKAVYQTCLQSVTYNNASQNPNTTARVISFVINDGTTNSAAATKTVTMAAAPDAPVVTTTAGTTSFTEDGGAVVVDSLVTVTDADSANLASATVTITNPQDGASEVLAASACAGLTVTPGLNTLSITGSQPPATYQTCLQSVTYNNTSQNPGMTARVISFVANDGALSSVAATKTMTVAAVPDAPVVTTTAGTTSFTEDGGPVVVDAGVTVTDADSTNLASATVTITNPQDGASEVLGATACAGLTVTPGLNTLSITGSQPPAAYQTCLQSVTYNNASQNPGTTPRVISFVANDGSASSVAATKTVTVASVPDAPVVTTTGGTTAFTEDGGPVVVDSGLTVTDADSANLAQATVTITNPQDGASEVLSATACAGLTVTPGLNTLSITGSQPPATYQTCLRSVTYNNTSQNPGTTARVISFVANDGALNSVVATKTVSVASVPDAPVVTTTAGTTSFTEDGGPVVVDSGVTVTDSDSANLASATVTITNPQDGASETLVATACVGLTVTPGLNTLSITGSQPPATYQTCLQSVTYNNSSQNPGTTARVISFVANDGSASSVAATKTVSVTSVPDAPVVTTTAGTTSFTEDGGAVVVDSGVTVSDVDSANLASATVTITNPGPEGAAETLAASACAGLTVTPGLNSLSITGSQPLATYQTCLRSVTYNNSSQNPNATTRIVSFVVNDGSLSSVAATKSVSVTPVPDAPVPTNNPISYSTAGNTQLHVKGKVLPGVAAIADAQGIVEKAGPFVDPDGPMAPSIVDASGTTANGGTYDIDTDGSFTYVPAAGFTGSDTFNYQVTDSVVTASYPVNITVGARVWYIHDVVDANNAAGGDGRSTNAFDTLAAFNAATTNDNDIIFVFRGNTGTTPLSGGITLRNGQKLHGQGVGLTVSPFGTVVAAGARPRISNTGGDAVSVLATAGNRQNVEIRGLDLSGSVNGIDVTATGANLVGVTISDNVISAAGAEGIDLNAGSTGAFAATLANNTIAGTGNAFDARTSAATAMMIDFHDNAAASNATAILIDGAGGGTTTITGFANNAVSGNTGGTGISINAATFDQVPGGTFQTVSGGTSIIGAPGNGVGGSGFVMTSVSGDLSYTDLDVFADGTGLSASGTAAYTGSAGLQLSVGATSSATSGSGPAVSLSTVSGSLVFTGVTTTGSSTTGISLVNFADGSSNAVFSATGGSLTSSAGASGPLFNVSGGNAKITYPGAITNNGTGRAVSISNWSGDDASPGDDLLLSGAIDENGAGILVNNNGGSRSITFSGGMDIDTTTGEGFAATSNTNTGGLHITGTNTIDSVSAAALRVVNTTIGNSNLNFQRISSGNNTAAADPANGIVLSNTGTSGGLIVTGNGGSCTEGSSTCTGGWIQNMTGGDDSGPTPGGTGIVLNNTANVSLTRMRINDTSNYGIRGTSVSGFTFTNGVVDGANGTNVSTPFNEGSMLFFGVTGTSSGMTGTSSITNSTIMGGRQRNIAIDNSVGSLNLTVSGNIIKRTSDAAGDDGFFLEADTTANVTLAITNNTFARHGGDHINISLVNNAVVDATITNNILHGNYPGTPEGNHPIGLGQGIFILGASFNGTFTYEISGNGTDADPFRGNRQGGAINVNKGSGTGTFSGSIENNVIGDPAVTGSGSLEAFGIIVGARGAGGAHTTLINNNKVRQYFDRGIVLEAGEGSAALNATVTNNIVSNFADATNSLHGIHSDNGILAADTNAVCLQISGNSVATAGNEPQGGADIRLRRGSNTTVRLPGVAGATNANATTLLQANNPTATTITVTGNGFSSGAACPLP